MTQKTPSPVRAWAFWIPVGLWLGLAGLLLMLTDQHELHLTLNSLNVLGGDTFYTSITYLGDRRVAWIFGVVLCFRQIRHGAAVLTAAIGAGLTTEALKYGMFGPVPRPVAFFGEPSPLYLVPGFENHLQYSMPSGHAAIAFALCTSLALQIPSRWAHVAFALAAICAGYSRVFLSEHFLEDVVAGAVVGLAWGLIAYALVRPNKAPPPECEDSGTTV